MLLNRGITMNKSGFLILFVFSLLLMISAIAVVPATAADDSSSSTLRVDVLKYEPYPADIGDYVSVWVKVENYASGEAEDVSIKIEPEYPLSLDSETNAIQNFGRIPPDRTAIYEYRLYVDENAKTGTGSFDVLYRADSDLSWVKESFDIKVGSNTFDSKGTVKLANVISDPQVFMPGDEGSISFTLENNAQSNTIVIDGETYDTYARVQSATLEGTDQIEITSQPYEGKGVLGPGDSIQVTYNVEVDENIEDGTYYLDLLTIGNSHSFNNNWRVPIVVDSCSLEVIPSKSLTIENGQGTLEFDVANVHPNALSSVAVSLEAEGVSFSPSNYFVGSMDPDELFTIEIDAKSDQKEFTGTRNVTIIASFRNGLNEHEFVAGERSLEFEKVQEDNNTAITVAAVLGLVLLIVAVYMYRRKWNPKE
jgi:hypothetical protein